MTLVATELDALDVMYELVLEDGSLWGEVACDLQKDDVEAIFRGPCNKHFETRPRGGSKSTDIAGVVTSWLKAEARPRAHAYVVASNADQAAEVIDAATGLIERTELLEGLDCENERIINRDNGAWCRVLPASESGAWGKRDAHLLICDEFAQWPDTRGARRVWTAVRTTVQKTAGCQLVILTSAGEPSHWSWPIFQNAKTGRDGWRTSEMPGPVPWQSEAEIEALRHELAPSEFERLVLNIWTESEDRAISEEDFEAAARECIVHGAGRRVTLLLKGYENPRKGVRYTIFVDIGTVNDATVIVVAHTEPLDPDEPKGPRRLVIDRLDRWQGTKRSPVQISQVEDHCAILSWEWNRARLVGDPAQFVGSMQSLNKRGVKADEFVFGATTVGQVATALVQTFRNQLIIVPKASVLKDELLSVKLRESSPGVTRLDHDRSGHDDQAVTLGMAAHTLIASQKAGGAAVFREFMRSQREKQAEDPETRRMSREDRDFERGVRQIMRRRTGRSQGTTRCDHRWRGDECVYGCGTSREEVVSA